MDEIGTSANIETPSITTPVQNTRKNALTRIKSSRHLKIVFKNVFANVDDLHTELSTLEFIMVSTLYQINANYLFLFMQLAIIYEPVATYIIYTILTSMLGVPLSMLLTFMSSYTKKSILLFWQCVPLFEGLGYTIIILRLSIEVFNVTYAGIALMFLLRTLNSNFQNDVQNCEFVIGTAFENNCVPPQLNETQQCGDIQPYTAFQLYYRLSVTKYSLYAGWPAINYPFLWAVTFVWALIFLLACPGMKGIRKFAVYPRCFFIVTMMLLSLCIIAMAEKKSIPDSTYYENPIMKFDFWVTVILHASEINYLGNTICIGTMKTASLQPKFAVLLTFPIKLLVFMSMLALMSFVLKDNAVYYKFANVDCLNPSPDDIMFVFAPDVLLRYKLWRLCLFFWYMSLFYFLILPPTYSMISFLVSLEAKYPRLRPYRMIMCAVICIIGMCCSVPLVSQIGSFILVMWKYCGLSLSVATLILVVNLAIFFVYTTDEVINDYTFTYGRPPEKFWTALWKCCPLFSLFAFLFSFKIQSTNIFLAAEYKWILAASYVHSALVLAPIPIVAAIKFCKHAQTERLGELIEPSREWGPPDEALRLTRHRYYPRRNIRFRIGKIICKHKCSVFQKEPNVKEKSVQKERVGSVLNVYS